MKSWTPEEDAALRALYATESTASEIAEHLGRTRAAVKCRVNTIGLRKPEGMANIGRFVKGGTSWNKGRHFDPGGRSVETRFKPGNRPHTWNPIGHVRTTADGYLERKLTDTGCTRRDYVGLHILLWREHHGEIPRGHAIVFRNGDKTDIRIENLECVTRQELMRRNSYHTNYPKPVRRLIQLRGAITRQINKRTKEAA